MVVGAAAAYAPRRPGPGPPQGGEGVA